MRFKPPVRIILLLCLALTAKAQSPRLRHLSVNEGLPSNTVYDVYADSKGYLWIGTEKGIARYNGTRFEYFTTSNGLPENVIFCFKEDLEHRLWISTSANVLCYYADGIFHTPENTPFLRLPYHSLMSDIAVASDSSITIYYAGVRRFISIRGNRLLQYDLHRYDSLALGKPVRVVRLPHKGYKILYAHEWLEIDDAGGYRERYPASHYFRAVFDRTYKRELLYDGQAIYDTDEKKLQVLSSSHLDQYSGYIVACWGPQHRFLCTGNGIFDDEKQLHLLAGQHTAAVTIDAEGNYWIGVLDEGGVYSIHKGLLDIQELPAAYTGKVIYGKSTSDGLFFITDTGDLYCLKNGAVSRVYSNHTGDKVKKEWFLLPAISNDLGYFIFSGRKSYYIRGGARVQEVSSEIPLVKSPWMIKQVAADSSNIYFMQHGKVLVQPAAEAMFSTAQRKKGWSFDTDSKFISFAFDEKGSLWLSTSEGLRKLNGWALSAPSEVKSEFRQFGFYRHCLVGYTNRNQLLLIKDYETLHPRVDTLNAGNSLWNGIYPVDSTHLIITSNDHYRLLQLLPSPKNDYSLHIIENNFIPAHAEFITADTANCYFFRDNTITTVKKNVMFERVQAPRVLFTGLKTPHRQLAVKPVVTVSYDEARELEIAFDYITFNAGEIRCEYRITSGNSGGWKNIDGEPSINLQNLAFGRYEVWLRVKTGSSDFSDLRHFTLIVERPYWARWWFIVICISGMLLLLSLLFIVIIKWILRKRQKQFHAEMTLQKSEFKALNALMNPHFIFNSLNNIQSLINKKEVEKANNYLVIFSRLVRQNMHNIDREYISLDKEIRLVDHYLQLEQLRFPDRFQYEIKLELPTEEIEDILIPALLLQPLAENAVKHGLQPKSSGSNYLELKVFEEGEVLVIEIRDNGIGLTASGYASESRYESFAVNNINRRIAYFNSLYARKIAFELNEIREDGAVKGTVARITITEG